MSLTEKVSCQIQSTVAEKSAQTRAVARLKSAANWRRILVEGAKNTVLVRIDYLGYCPILIEWSDFRVQCCGVSLDPMNWCASS